MNTLPLWRRCRALANPLRLDMLTLLARSSPQYVKEIAETLQITEEVACKNLQLMASAGFIIQQYVGKYLYYSLVEQDELISGILNYELTQEQVIHTVTALTHERRVLILLTVDPKPLGLTKLCRKTGVSMRAMKRQLDKLVRRGFIKIENGRCTVTPPDSVLGIQMVELALKSGTPAQVCRRADREQE